MSLSILNKKLLVTCSNISVLALVALAVANTWDAKAFQIFLKSKLSQVWPYLMIYPAFVAAMSSLPAKPDREPITSASAPSTAQARSMAISTAIIDYTVAGALLLFWDSTCRLEDGTLCPFTAAGTLFVGAAVMPIKDEIQCRILWRKFISPYKLQSWPYNWKSFLDQLTTSVPFAVLSLLLLCFADMFSFDSILHPKVLLQVWSETLAVTLVADAAMHFLHSWMHKKAYFLHKNHHKGNTDLMSFFTPLFDSLDFVFEFGVAVPVLIFCKKMFGLCPCVHMMTFNLQLLAAFQLHSGNPYAVYLFNPVLDYLARSALCHNLHHAVLTGYYTFIPFCHFLSAEARYKDIEKYNMHMKTHFPRHI